MIGTDGCPRTLIYDAYNALYRCEKKPTLIETDAIIKDLVESQFALYEEQIELNFDFSRYDETTVLDIVKFCEDDGGIEIEMFLECAYLREVIYRILARFGLFVTAEGVCYRA